MKRVALDDLKAWLKKPDRKPMVLRGARQVGKSTLVHLFCQQEGLELLELNMEIESLNSISGSDFELQRLLNEIQLKKKQSIHDKTLIFFDEIQASPKLLQFLRYFYEQEPNIKLIAAGSLLEIALKSESFSFPVGRVEFYHLGPMSFREFLWACGEDLLDKKLSDFEFTEEVHLAAIRALKNYYYVGGMPAVVKRYIQSQSIVEVRDLQSQILQTYQADFPKYNNRINTQRIARIFNALALHIGKKVIYSKLDRESTSREVKRVVELLFDSRVFLNCVHSDGNSIPLLGESDPKIYKTYLLDIGLLNSLLRLDYEALELEFKNNFNTSGAIAEQFVAQHLVHFQGPSFAPSLSYHLRDKGSQKAEVGFLIEWKRDIYPLEVKASSKGHLKSLKYFALNKKSKLCFKVCLDQFQVDPSFAGKAKLVTLPIYALEYLKENFAGLTDEM